MLVYCIVTIEGKLFSSNKDISADFGKDETLTARLSDNTRRDTSEVESLNNAVDALNYLSSIGWNLVHLMPFTAAAGTTVETLRYLMSREL